MLVLDFLREWRLGGVMDEPNLHHDLAERLVLHAGALAEALATDAARVRAEQLCGMTGDGLAETGQSISLLLEAAAALVKSTH